MMVNNRFLRYLSNISMMFNNCLRILKIMVEKYFKRILYRGFILFFISTIIMTITDDMYAHHITYGNTDTLMVNQSNWNTGIPKANQTWWQSFTATSNDKKLSKFSLYTNGYWASTATVKIRLGEGVSGEILHQGTWSINYIMNTWATYTLSDSGGVVELVAGQKYTIQMSGMSSGGFLGNSSNAYNDGKFYYTGYGYYGDLAFRIYVNEEIIDSDGDGIDDNTDVCPNNSSISQNSEKPTYYPDSDGDGVGINPGIESCESSPPAGYSATNTDSCPNNAGLTQQVTRYLDSDGDGFPNNFNGEGTCILGEAGYIYDDITNLEEDMDDDNDGFLDSIEIELGSDPLNINSLPMMNSMFIGIGI